MFRILPQYWALNHGKGMLKSIKVEGKCGDVREYPAGKLTWAQQEANVLAGRKR